MNKARVARWVAAGAGAAAAAVATGVVVERRVVKARKAASRGADELGGLRGDAVEVRASDGVLLHAEVDEVAPYDTGRKHAPDEVTVVLVHGYALNLDCWHFQRRHLRGKRRIVLFDQRSHGRSGRSSMENADIDQTGRDLKTVLDELVPEGPVVLVGHSMGGMTIMALAEQHPELFGDRVVGAALVATSAGGLRPHRILSKLIPDSVGGQAGLRLMALLSRAPELVDSARRIGSNIGFLVTDQFAFGEEVPASYVEFVDEMLAGTPFEVLAEFYPNFEKVDKYAVLHSFEEIPTSVVCGTKDVITSVGHSRKLATRITGSRLVEIAGAGHMVIMERADRVNAALDDVIALAEQRHAESRAS